MSCSTEEYKSLGPVSCNTFPELEKNTHKGIYVVVDPLDEMFIGKSELECKTAIIDAVQSSMHYSHLHNLTVDDLILVRPDQVKVHGDSKTRAANEVKALMLANDTIETAKQLVEEMSKCKTAKDYEKLKPSAQELRARNTEYKNRQRHHNRK